jgi:hypothetical protein
MVDLGLDQREIELITCPVKDLNTPELTLEAFKALDKKHSLTRVEREEYRKANPREPVWKAKAIGGLHGTTSRTR